MVAARGAPGAGVRELSMGIAVLSRSLAQVNRGSRSPRPLSIRGHPEPPLSSPRIFDPRAPARSGILEAVSKLIRRRVVIHGIVQGVFFRESTRRQAEGAGVNGWVRNLQDGTVEAAFEGALSAVEALLEFCRCGPPGAQVTDVEVFEEVPQGDTGFAVR
jgi:acylphosphatase